MSDNTLNNGIFADSYRLIAADAPVLVTGSNGFIGTRLVEVLLECGLRRLRCLVRSTTHRTDGLYRVLDRFPGVKVDVVEGNLLSPIDARRATKDVQVVFHLAAGIEKSFPGSYLNTVVTTRNLLDVLREDGQLKRFVNVSSLAVYSNRTLRRRALLDEACPLEPAPVERGEAYVYAKLKQEELVREYAERFSLPHVIVRPGAVYGPGKADLTGRVGIGTFGIFLHLGGRNRIPFTHVRNCAEAIALAGLTPGVDGEVFNVVDDDLPTSRQFMAGYRSHVGRKRYVPVPYPLFYALCVLWERHGRWSGGQLPPAFNRLKCSAYWKGNRYSNAKLKSRLGWRPSVSPDQGFRSYYAYLKTLEKAPC